MLIDWSKLGHPELVQTLADGLAEKEERVRALQALTEPQTERRGPGRPPGSKTEPKTRTEQLAAAAAADRGSEAVQ